MNKQNSKLPNIKTGESVIFERVMDEKNAILQGIAIIKLVNHKIDSDPNYVNLKMIPIS